MRPTLLLAFVSTLTLVVACDPLAPFAPTEEQGVECGAAPDAFDPAGDIVQGAGDAGCVRIERRAVPVEGDVPCDACAFEPQRLVLHVDGFSRRYDIDTTELTYQASQGNQSDVITTTTEDDVTVRIQYDICTGGWNLDVDDGEVLVPVVGL